MAPRKGQRTVRAKPSAPLDVHRTARSAVNAVGELSEDKVPYGPSGGCRMEAYARARVVGNVCPGSVPPRVAAIQSRFLQLHRCSREGQEID